MAKSNLDKVKEFHQAFEHPIAEVPEIPQLELRKLRAKLLIEEVSEFVSASGLMTPAIYNLFSTLEKYVSKITLLAVEQEGLCVSMVEVADALGDIKYVAEGANLVWGFPGDEIFNVIHDSNMSKLGPDGRPIKREDGKILKGPRYLPPQGKIQNLLLGIPSTTIDSKDFR